MSRVNFQGDVLFKSGNDGGEIAIVDGLVCDSGGIDTAIYLSLFGGNDNDDAGRDKKTWWGNLIPGLKENEKYVSRFQAITKAMPLTSGNLKKARDAAEEDLKWIVDEKIVKNVSVFVKAESKNRVRLLVSLSNGGEVLFEKEMEADWEW